MKILLSESEGIIRLEASALIHCLYSHERFEKERILEIYQIMATTATIDLHWEVKIKALKFWEEIIWEHLKEQGMIDGSFPEVTFSKERKKIIVLNEDEIKRRLNKVVGELDSIGCLQVLIKAIRDDPDIEVVETAVQITDKFAKLLKKYKMTEQRINNSFFELINQDFVKILDQRRKWLKESDTLEVVLSRMLEDQNGDRMD